MRNELNPVLSPLLAALLPLQCGHKCFERDAGTHHFLESSPSSLLADLARVQFPEPIEAVFNALGFFSLSFFFFLSLFFFYSYRYIIYI